MSNEINGTSENTTQSTATEPTAAQPTFEAAFSAMSPSEQLAMIARLQQAKADTEAKAKAEAEAIINATISDLNELLHETSGVLLTAGSIALQFNPAVKVEGAETIPAFYSIVRIAPKQAEQAAARVTQTRTNGPASSTTSARVSKTVDGVEYRSYNQAYAELGYTWTGKNPSFNARLALMECGHVCGEATR